MRKKNIFRSILLCMILLVCATTKAQIIMEETTSVQPEKNKSRNLRVNETSMGFWVFGNDATNFGASWNRYGMTPQGIGIEFNVRSSFKKYGNSNADLGVNYLYPLWEKDNNRLFLIGALGPSVRGQKVPYFTYNAATGYMTELMDFKVFLDLFANARVMVAFNKFRVSAGVFLWSAQFKFNKDFTNIGFSASLGYDI